MLYLFGDEPGRTRNRLIVGAKEGVPNHNLRGWVLGSDRGHTRVGTGCLNKRIKHLGFCARQGETDNGLEERLLVAALPSMSYRGSQLRTESRIRAIR